MGNSLLDVIVFGRDAGKAAAAKAKDVEPRNHDTWSMLREYAEELKSAGAGHRHDVSPQLLPEYAGKRHL